MTDRVSYLTVALDQDMRTDDVQAVVEAIRMVKHVQAVELGVPTSSAEWTNRERIRIELTQKLWEVLKP